MHAPPDPILESVLRYLQAIPLSTWNAQRWFGGKGRPFAGVSIRDVATVPSDAANSLLALVEVQFQQGQADTYFLPLTIRPDDSQPPDVSGELARLNANGAPSILLDGLTDQQFCLALLQLIKQNAVVPAQRGRFVFEATKAFAEIVGPEREPGLSARPLPPHQSNSLVSYGDRALLKCFRRVVPGINPDLEVTYFLTTRTDFRNIPRMAGKITYHDAAGEWPLAVMQSYVRNQGNAWETMLAELHKYYEQAAKQSEPSESHTRRMAERLGERTGQLHVALASDPKDPNFAPEPATPDDRIKWADAITRELNETLELLQSRRDTIAEHLQADRNVVLQSGPKLVQQIQRFKQASDSASATLYKTRIHGDYHLGQVLATDGDFVIIDFEGEPLRPLQQRRAKQLAVKDVAGMLRSFNYAGFAALFEAAPGMGISQEKLELWRKSWEEAMREAFWQAYQQAVATSKLPLLPPSPEGRQDLLALFELEKALYELRYEIDNRPDWLRIPISGIRQILNAH